MNRMEVAHAVMMQLIVLSLLCATLNAQTETQRPPQCREGLVVDCRLDYADIVWAMDEKQTCKVIRNRCIFNNINCSKYRSGQPFLKEIPQNECQRMCSQECSQAPAQRICAKRGRNLCYFVDECALDKNICNTGEIWVPQLNRFCDESENKGICMDL